MKQYQDQCLIDTDWILKKIHAENRRQLRKWGVQSRTAFEWITYTTEELGELANAIGEYEYRDGAIGEVVKEAIQVATLALKIAEMFEKEGE